VSVAVGAAAGQHENDPGAVALEAHASVSYAQPPLISETGELDHVTSRGFAREAMERIDDSSLDGRAEALEVAPRAAG
jgi:hypothetical protein